MRLTAVVMLMLLGSCASGPSHDFFFAPAPRPVQVLGHLLERGELDLSSAPGAGPGRFYFAFSHRTPSGPEVHALISRSGEQHGIVVRDANLRPYMLMTDDACYILQDDGRWAYVAGRSRPTFVLGLRDGQVQYTLGSGVRGQSGRIHLDLTRMLRHDSARGEVVFEAPEDRLVVIAEGRVRVMVMTLDQRGADYPLVDWGYRHVDGTGMELQAFVRDGTPYLNIVDITPEELVRGGVELVERVDDRPFIAPPERREAMTEAGERGAQAMVRVLVNRSRIAMVSP